MIDSSDPQPVRLDPRPTVGRSNGKWKIENGNRLRVSSTRADGDDLIGLGDIDTLYGDGHAENNRFEWNSKILLDLRSNYPDFDS